MIRRGEIYWVQLDPTIGAEIKKTRPALVASNDQNNQFSELITVLPITSKTKSVYPFEVELRKGQGGLKVSGKVKANQIRTVDKRRLSAKPLGKALETEIMERVAVALKLHLSLE
jgi:mRNA interferase MazF